MSAARAVAAVVGAGVEPDAVAADVVQVVAVAGGLGVRVKAAVAGPASPSVRARMLVRRGGLIALLNLGSL